MSDSKKNEEDELINCMNSVSFSTPEEKLAKQLDATHIAPKRSSFQRLFAGTTSTAFPADIPPPAGSNASNANPDNDAEDGWGEAPSYTSIQQGTYFGFSSIIESNHLPTKSAIKLQPNQPFASFQNLPPSCLSSADASNNHQR